MADDFLISRRVFDAQQLMAAHPPRWQHRNKKAVARISCPPGSVHSGRLTFSRWQERPLPETYGASATVLEGRADAFQYAPPPPGRTVAWHLNFAHFDVFAFYGGGLFAQDEMQVTEHPALGALREALLTDAAVTPATVEAGRPTPVLVHGVERRCIVDTAPDPDRGRPDGLYGNNFAAAKAAVVEQATRALTPPTVSNILAIEAPSYGTGTYTRDAIRFI